MPAIVSEKCVNGLELSVLEELIGAIKTDPELAKCRFRARNKWIDGAHNCSTITGFYAAKGEHTHKRAFELHADEPPMLAGSDEWANPVEYLLGALASCVTTAMLAHAAVRGIHVESLESELEGDIDMRGFLGLADDVPKGYSKIRVKFRVETDPANIPKLRKLAEFSPVYNTLINGTDVDIQLEPK